MALKWLFKQVSYGTPAHDQINRGRKGNTTTLRALDLNQNPYVTGGWILDGADHLMQEIWDVEEVKGLDMLGRAIAPVGVSLHFTKLPGGRFRMKWYKSTGTAPAEVANGFTPDAGSICWIRFTGTR